MKSAYLFILSIGLVACGGGGNSPKTLPQEVPAPLSGVYELTGLGCFQEGFNLLTGYYSGLNSVLAADYQAGRIYTFNFTSKTAVTMVDTIATAIQRSIPVDCSIRHDVEIAFESETTIKIVKRVNTTSDSACDANDVQDAINDFEGGLVGDILTFVKRNDEVILDYFDAAGHCGNGVTVSNQGALRLKKKS